VPSSSVRAYVHMYVTTLQRRIRALRALLLFLAMPFSWLFLKSGRLTAMQKMTVFSFNWCYLLSKMPVDCTEDRLHYGRRVSDICKARELQWLRCGTEHSDAEEIHQSTSHTDQRSNSGHGSAADVKQQWATVMPRYANQSHRNNNIYNTKARFLIFKYFKDLYTI